MNQLAVNLLMEYWAARAGGEYQPLITDGLVCYDPLVEIHDAAQYGGQAMTGSSYVEPGLLHGVKCLTCTGNHSVAHIAPTNMPSNKQPFTYAAWTCNTTYASGTRLMFLRGLFVTSGNPRRFAVHRNVSYDNKVLCDLKSGSNSKPVGGYTLDGTWKHNLVTYDGYYFVWYIDGNLKWVASNITMAMPASANLELNAIGDGLNGFSRVYVFNRALTSAEIATLANEDIGAN